MRTNKDGTPDKRYKVPKETKIIETSKKMDDLRESLYIGDTVDPNVLLNQFLEENGIELDFDVVSGTIPTKQGIIKLDKPTLTLKAKYV